MTVGDTPREQREFGCRVSRWLEFWQRRKGFGTDTELAAAMRVSKQSVGQWLGYRDPEQARGCPTLLTLYAMHEHLRVPIAQIFDRAPTDAEVATGRYEDEQASAPARRTSAAS